MVPKKNDDKRAGSDTGKKGLNHLQWFSIITAILIVLLVIIIDYYYRKACI